MKICPKCGSNKVSIFDSNNDYCLDCEEWFSAVKDIRPIRFKAEDLLSFARYLVDNKKTEEEIQTAFKSWFLANQEKDKKKLKDYEIIKIEIDKNLYKRKEK